ncbi:hypothetical protein [Streptomyces sp. NPDC046909]|uniref:hypothetical protein n=1 Tax=Streptomyces sp. NPDC046909 TaxID=3155617 RepID=UPI0033C41616
MKIRRLFRFTEETVLYAFGAVLLFLAFAVGGTVLGIVLVPFAVLGAVGLFLLARRIGRDGRAPTSRP